MIDFTHNPRRKSDLISVRAVSLCRADCDFLLRELAL